MAQTPSSSEKKVNKSVAFFLCCGIELAHHAWFRWCTTCVSYFFYATFVVAGRMMRQVAQSSMNYGWGCGKISVANDAKVNLKGDSHGSEEKSSKEKSS
jgi:hypothetical protein